MTTTTAIRRPPHSSSLADVLEVILDKGIVIDAYVRVSLVGIELLTIDARVVIASVDTYLRYAEAVDRLYLGSAEDAKDLPELFQATSESASKSKTKGATAGALETVKDKLRSGNDQPERSEDDRQEQEARS